jgi:hypothetical protein
MVYISCVYTVYAVHESFIGEGKFTMNRFTPEVQWHSYLKKLSTVRYDMWLWFWGKCLVEWKGVSTCQTLQLSSSGLLTLEGVLVALS